MPRSTSKDRAAELTGFMDMRARLVARYPELSPQLQEIAQFALTNPETMAVETAVKLAERLHVQPSALVRFAQALGYGGFNDMKRVFRAHLIFRMADMRDLEATRQKLGAVANDTLATLLAESRAQLDAIAKVADQLPFEQATAALAAANQLYVTAQHVAFPFASLFTWTLLRLGRQCHILDNTGGFALRQSELATPADAILAIGLAPYQPSVIQAAKAHRERGGVVVAITDSALNPLAPNASIVLEAPLDASSTGQSVAAVTCLVQALALAVGQRRD